MKTRYFRPISLQDRVRLAQDSLDPNDYKTDEDYLKALEIVADNIYDSYINQ